MLGFPFITTNLHDNITMAKLHLWLTVAHYIVMLSLAGFCDVCMA